MRGTLNAEIRKFDSDTEPMYSGDLCGQLEAHRDICVTTGREAVEVMKVR